MKMKITLINLPWTFEIRWQGNTSIYPPLGLCYIASVLRDIGKFDVEIIDCPVLGLNKDQIKERLEKSKPDIVGIACISPVLHNITIEVSNIIKNIDKNILVVIGGPYATSNYNNLLKENNIDIVMLGESEFTMLDVSSSVKEKKSFSKIKGIAYKEKNQIKCSEQRELLKDLDNLPFPAFDLLPSLNLYKPAFRYKRLPMISINTSRGCPHTCLFCSSRISGYRYNSAEYVFNELKFLHEKFGIKEFYITDENFAILNNRVEKICDLIIKNKLDITWSCAGVTIASLSGNGLNIIPKMAKAGCWYIGFGLESGNIEILKNNKATKIQNLDNVRKVLRECQRNGIFTKGYFMLGLPTDTKKTIRETIDFAKSLPLDGVQFSLPVPYPGTEFYDFAIESGGPFFSEDFDNMSGHANNPVYAPEGITREWLKKAQREAYREFYFRPNYIAKALFKKVRSFEDLKRYVRQGSMYLKKTVLYKNSLS